MGYYRDITALVMEEQKAQAERLEREKHIRRQDAALRQVSTPLVPIFEQIVVMPLVGNIDEPRAQQVMNSLLEGVMKHNARHAILDITGVPMVDQQVASALISAARAAKLLGATVILTGVRAEVAQALLQLQIDMSGFVTCSTLQQGVAHALRSDQSIAKK